MVDENSVVDRNSIKLVDESSVVVENTGLKLEEVDEKTVVYQSVFSLWKMQVRGIMNDPSEIISPHCGLARAYIGGESELF